MMPKPNGILVKWALGLLAAGILGLGGWGGRTIIHTSERVSVLEGVHAEIKEALIRLDQKVERLLERAR
jgi:hypothetical protein